MFFLNFFSIKNGLVITKTEDMYCIFLIVSTFVTLTNVSVYVNIFTR